MDAPSDSRHRRRGLPQAVGLPGNTPKFINIRKRVPAVLGMLATVAPGISLLYPCRVQTRRKSGEALSLPGHC